MQNEGKAALQDLPLALSYDRSLYALEPLPPLTHNGYNGEGGRAAAAADSLVNIPLLLPVGLVGEGQGTAGSLPRETGATLCDD